MSQQQQADVNLSDIFDKIARLRALEERAGTPDEAAAAAAAVQRLMFRYNLSQAQVESARRNDQQGYEKATIGLGVRRGAAYRWKQTLVHGICDYNFCRSIEYRNATLMEIVGEKHNLRVVEGLYDYLEKEIRRLCDEAWVEFGNRDSRLAVKWKNGFYSGAVDGVVGKLREQYEASMRSESGSQALVLVKDEELNLAFAEFFPDAVMRKKKQSIHADSFAVGLVQGRRINLAKQVEA